MSELTDRQAAIARALTMLHESIEENIDEDEISVTGVAVELYLVGMAMKQGYWPAATKITDHFCELVGIDQNECHRVALSLVAQAQGEMGDLN